MKITIKKILEVCNGSYYGEESALGQTITAITTDSRKVEEGSLFAAIKGARSDGHDFISSVFESGGACCLSEKVIENEENPYIVVPSVLQSLKDIAEYYRTSLPVKVVGITGSVGKTSTKEMIAAVLEQKYEVLKTLGNFNNELGLPLTVFRLQEKDEIAVLEMGISDFREMHRLSKIARPDICVMTNIGFSHLENLKNQDGILKAKSEIFDYMAENGTVILNGDDPKLSEIKEVKEKRPVFFGKRPDVPFYAKNITNLGLKGTNCDICIWDFAEEKELKINVTIPIPGEHMVYNALAGAAVGRCFGLTPEEIKKGIESLVPLAGRNHMIETACYTIIDDCYNANPVSMKASIDVLSYAPGRKVCILGDMGELGKEEEKLHSEIGEYAAEKKVDLLICAGRLSKHMAVAAEKNNCRVKYYKDKEALLKELDSLLKEQDTILIKASHFMEFSEIVKYLS